MAWTELTRRKCAGVSDKYASDLSDAEWALIAPLMGVDDVTVLLCGSSQTHLGTKMPSGGGHIINTPLMPPVKTTGRPRTTNLRDVFDAILYVATTGCPWRMLPNDFPPVSTARGYFYAWRNDGLLGEINRKLVEAARLAEGRNAQPRAGIIDSQSVKSTKNMGVTGYDAGKRIKGRQRHIVINTIGLLVGLEEYRIVMARWSPWASEASAYITDPTEQSTNKHGLLTPPSVEYTNCSFLRYCGSSACRRLSESGDVHGKYASP